MTFDPSAKTFSPYFLGMTAEEIGRRVMHYRRTGETTMPAWTGLDPVRRTVDRKEEAPEPLSEAARRRYID